MRYLKYMILLIILLPLMANASDAGIRVDCPKDIKKNKEFTCDIKGYADFEVSAIEYQFSLPDNIEKKDFKVDSIWQGDEENNLVLLYTDENKKDEFNIGTITLVSKKNLKKVEIKTESLLFGDQDYNEHLLVDAKDVNEVKSKSKKESDKKNNIAIYGIIILIIAIAILIIVFIKRKGVRR